MNCELSDVQTGFRKGRETRDQIANICWIIEKPRELQNNIYLCFTDYTKAFDCVDHKKLQKFLKTWEYQTTWSASWEICMQFKKQQLELDMEQIETGSKLGKGVCQGCILPPCLFNFYAEYIIQNSGLDEAQAGIEIAGRKINNLRYADDIPVMTESEDELKNLLMRVKERVKKLA